MLESPNKLLGWNGKKPEGIIIHYTAGSTLAGAYNTLMNPKTKASAHVIIDKDGSITNIVSVENRAWHAGTSSWIDKSNCNNFMLGIELVNVGYLNSSKYENGKTKITTSYGSLFIGESQYDFNTEKLWDVFPQEQIDTLIEVVNEWQEKFQIPNSMVVGHSHISPKRKIDPGPLFPWYRIEENCLTTFDSPKEYLRSIQSHLTRLDFECGTIDGIYGKNTLHALTECSVKYNFKFDGKIENNEKYFSNLLRRIY